ncbi:CheY-like superfamily, partial [Gaertneriomyces semiglobifer]
LNILLVEDSKILQEIFKKWWQKKGHNVFVASNGQEAIEMFKARMFSIIFLDIEIPIKDGLTVAREI